MKDVWADHPRTARRIVLGTASHSVAHANVEVKAASRHNLASSAPYPAGAYLPGGPTGAP